MMKIMDGEWLLYSHDEKAGRTTWARENGDGTTTFRTDCRVDPVIEENKAVRNMASKGWAGDYHRIASVPLNVFYDQLHKATLQNDDAYISRWLNDSDNGAWRTKEGQV